MLRLTYLPVLIGLVAYARWQGSPQLGLNAALLACLLVACGYSALVLALLRRGRLSEGLCHLSGLVDSAVASTCLGATLGLSSPPWLGLLPVIAILYLVLVLLHSAARLVPFCTGVAAMFVAAGAAVAVAVHALSGVDPAGLVGPAALPVGLLATGFVAWILARSSLRLLVEHYRSDVLERMSNKLHALDQALLGSTEGVSAAWAELESSAAVAAARQSQVDKGLEAAASAGERLGTEVGKLKGSVSSAGASASRTLALAAQAAESIRVLSARISGLQEAAHRMGTSLDLINEVTEQTRLLSLNAAIEAARGEGGGAGGFSVVAEEIRTLAERSAGITSEIGRLVKQIRGVIAAGGDSSRDAGHILERIRIDTGDFERFVQGVQRGVDEQTTAVRVLRENLEKTQTLASEGAPCVDGIRQVAARLREESLRLREVLDRAPQASQQPATQPAPRTTQTALPTQEDAGISPAVVQKTIGTAARRQEETI